MLTPEERSPARFHWCCACSSRTWTIIANVLLIFGACVMYKTESVVGGLQIKALGFANDERSSALIDDERLLIWVLLGSMIFQIVVSTLAIWGAFTYRGWPVMVSLGWDSIGVVLSFVNMVLHNPYLYAAILIGIHVWFIWTPMYEYLLDYEALKAEASTYAVAESGERESDDGLLAGRCSDEDGSEKKAMATAIEMV